MRIQAGMLLSSLLILGSFAVSADVQAGNDKAKGSNGKVYICHLTSSATNPSVLIHVSSSAARAHYDHGDPLEYTNLGYGECSAEAPPPPPLEVCAFTDFEGATGWWRLEYQPGSGTFAGFKVIGGDLASGTISPPGDIFVEGKLITFDVGMEIISTSSSGASPVFGFGDGLAINFPVTYGGALAKTAGVGIVEKCDAVPGM